MIVKEQKTIELVNACGATYHESEVVAALAWLAALYGKPVQRLKRVFLYGKYPAISIYGDKIHLHRAIGMSLWRDTDFEFDVKYVHHKNHNKMDARSENLELIGVSDHQSHHTKGRIFTEEHKRKISEGNRSRWRKLRPELYENPELKSALADW